MGSSNSNNKDKKENEEEKENKQNPFDYPFIYIGEIFSVEDKRNSSFSGTLISDNCVLTSASALYKATNRTSEILKQEDVKEEVKEIPNKDDKNFSPIDQKHRSSMSAAASPMASASGKSLIVNQYNNLSFPAYANKIMDIEAKANEDVGNVDLDIKNPINFVNLRFKPIRTKEKVCLGEIKIVDVFVPDEFLISPNEIKNDWAILKLEEPIGIKIKYLFGRVNNVLNKSVLNYDLYQFQITIGYIESHSLNYYEPNIGNVRNCDDDNLHYLFDNVPSNSHVGAPILIKSNNDFFLIGIHSNNKFNEDNFEIYVATKLTTKIYQQVLKQIEVFREIEISKYEDSYSDRYYSYVTCLVNIGYVCEVICNFKLSLEFYVKALKVKISLLGENHISVATSYNNMGYICKEMNKMDDAIENMEKALKIFLNLLGENDVSCAKIYTNLGLLYEKQYMYEQSLNAHEKALGINTVLFGKDAFELAESFYNFALVCFHLGKFNLSLKNFKKSLKIYKSHKKDNVTISKLYNNLANSYYSLGMYDKSIKYYQKNEEILISEYGDAHFSLVICYNNLGLVFKSLGNNDKALLNFEKSLEIHKNTSEKDTIELAKTYNNIGGIHHSNGNYEEAINSYEKAIKIKESICKSNDLSFSINYNNLGVIYKLQGKFNQAIEYYQKALNLKLEFLGEAHPSTITSYNNLGEVYKALNNEKLAQLYFDKAKQFD